MLDSHNHFNILKKWASKFEDTNIDENSSYELSVFGIQEYIKDCINMYDDLNLSDLFEAINKEIKEAGLCKV
jgi:hypothetical protein